MTGLWPRSYDHQLYFYLEPRLLRQAETRPATCQVYLLVLYLINDVSAEPGHGGHVHAVDKEQGDEAEADCVEDRLAERRNTRDEFCHFDYNVQFTLLRRISHNLQVIRICHQDHISGEAEAPEGDTSAQAEVQSGTGDLHLCMWSQRWLGESLFGARLPSPSDQRYQERAETPGSASGTPAPAD